MYGNLAGFVFATAKYTYETFDAARIANEVWETVYLWRQGNDGQDD